MKDKPPISFFEQLLEKAGVEMCNDVLTSEQVISHPEAVLTSWEGLIENLITAE